MQDPMQEISKPYQETFKNLFKMKRYVMFVARKTQHHQYIDSLQTNL